MRPAVLQVGPLAAANAAIIAASQSPGSFGAISLNGSSVVNGVAVLDTCRRVIITSGGNDSGITFTITGTDWAGNTIGETLSGANAGAAQTQLSYLTVASLSYTGSVASTVEVGTNGVADSPWVRLDPYGNGPTALQIDVAGTVNVTVQQSLDDCLGLTPASVARSAVTWVNHPDSTLVNATANVQGNYAYAPLWVRLLLNSSTQAAGNFATLTVQQLGAPRG
jgi:hypothetical protein